MFSLAGVPSRGAARLAAVAAAVVHPADKHTRLVVGGHEAALGEGFGQVLHEVLAGRLDIPRGNLSSSFLLTMASCGVFVV